jgi:HD superfamily phosphohydrolase
MFTQVYFHEVRRAYDLVLADLIGELLEEQSNTDTYPNPADLQEYLSWDDVKVLSSAAGKVNAETRNAAWMVLHRIHPKKVFSTLPHPDRIVAERAFRSLFQNMKTRFPGVRLWADRATDHPERYRREDMDIPVLLEAGHSESFASHAHALEGLKEIGQVRLYADVDDDNALKDEIAQACREYMA